jgi:pimeloyl-ACP methyl ester carboxylesterase
MMRKFVRFLFVLFVIGLVYMIWFVISLFRAPDMSKVPAYYPFKSAKKMELYLNYYDTRAKQWPVPSEAKYIQTSYGKTFVRISGPADAPVLALLPSASASSLIWIPNIKTLSQSFRVYAIDNISDFGRSINSRVIKNSDDSVSWLDELFTAMGLVDNINLMGLSLGGWITSQYALRHPERLHKIILAAPAATIIKLPGEWAWRGLLSALPNRRFMKKFMVDWMFQDLVKKKDPASIDMLNRTVDDAMMALKCYKFRMPLAPTVLTDDELRSFKIPVLFLVGEHEVIYPAEQAVQRINTVAPAIQTEIIRNASHDLTISQTEIVNDIVAAFLRE